MIWGDQWAARALAQAAERRRHGNRRRDPWGYWAWHKRRNLGRRAKEGDRMPTQADVLRIAQQQNFCCALTGWPLEPNEAVLDHVRPVCSGGPHTADNLQVVHKQVNAAKGVLPQGRFIAICRAVAQRHPEC